MQSAINYGRFDDFGPQELAHCAWLMVEIGNYYKDQGQEKQSLHARYRAWQCFTDPECRGHDMEGRMLVEENPQLKRFATVRGYYAAQGIGISPN